MPKPLALLFLCLLILGCTNQPEPKQRDRAASSPTLELVFAYAAEKKPWLEAVTADFNTRFEQISNGQVIQVRPIPLGSRELVEEILAGRVKAHLASPASTVLLEWGNSESLAQTNKPLIGHSQPLVRSPLVIAIWKPMAESLGWPEQSIGWSDVLALAKSRDGWKQHGSPEWGKFTWGHTHPEHSNSGLLALLCAVYTATGKPPGLTLEDLRKSEVAEYLESIQQRIVHYGSSTEFFGHQLSRGGPGFLSAVVVSEQTVMEWNRQLSELPFPLVAIYPSEGAFWSDHPIGVVQREWVSENHQEAAQKYIEFLRSRPQQRRAMEFGFRPGDSSIPLTSPIDPQHGVDPSVPQATLPAPSAQVLKATIEVWNQQKKPSTVVLALDLSGSMLGLKLQQMQAGATHFLDTLSGRTAVSLLGFQDRPFWTKRRATLNTERGELQNQIQSYQASGGTALLDAIGMAIEELESQPQTERIRGIVVLSDGTDTKSIKHELDALLQRLRQNRSIQVFTIGYGSEADKAMLEQIAHASLGKYYHATPETIDEVLKEIATFF